MTGAMRAMVLAALLGGALQAQEPEEDALGLAFELEDLNRAASEKLQAKDYPGAIEGWKKVLARVDASKLGAEGKRGHAARARYNIACAHALAGQKSEALEELGRAIELGFWSWDHIAKDGDLDSLRGDPAFAAAVEKGKAAERNAVEGRVAKAVADVKEALKKDPLLPGYDFDLVATDGKPLRLADLRGKVVIVTWFWPAIMDDEQDTFPELTNLVELRRSTDPEQLAIVGISMNVVYDQDGSGLKELMERRKIDFPVGRVPPEKIVKEAGLLFIDREGNVRANLRRPRLEVIEAVAKTLLEAR